MPRLSLEPTRGLRKVANHLRVHVQLGVLRLPQGRALFPDREARLRGCFLPHLPHTEAGDAPRTPRRDARDRGSERGERRGRGKRVRSGGVRGGGRAGSEGRGPVVLGLVLEEHRRCECQHVCPLPPLSAPATPHP
eukprot:2796156-Rhodomonas_salina.1